MTVMEAVVFSRKLVEGIKSHSLEAVEKGGYEAVGFLARPHELGVVSTLVRLNNHSSDPQRGFFVEPWEQFRAETKLKEAGYDIVGVYHSHPQSEALPSKADEAVARPDELVVIYSVAFDELTAWKEQDGKLVPQEVIYG